MFLSWIVSWPRKLCKGKAQKHEEQWDRLHKVAEMPNTEQRMALTHWFCPLHVIAWTLCSLVKDGRDGGWAAKGSAQAGRVRFQAGRGITMILDALAVGLASLRSCWSHRVTESFWLEGTLRIIESNQ